jgi:hypothetical protein
MGHCWAPVFPRVAILYVLVMPCQLFETFVLQLIHDVMWPVIRLLHTQDQERLASPGDV